MTQPTSHTQDGIASPNPSYPSEVKTVTGENTIDIVGRNLLPISSLTSTTSSGVTFTNNNDGSYTFNGTASGYVAFNLFTNLSFNGEYTYVLKDTATSGFVMYIQTSSSGVGNTTTHTTINNNISRIVIGINSGTTLNNITITPYVYSGAYDSSVAYEPYQSQSYPISLGSLELAKISTYKDKIYNDDNDKKWYLRKEIGKVILDGSENGWSYPSTNRFNLDNVITDYKKETNANISISDKYVSFAQTETNADFNSLVSNVNYGFNLSTSSWTYTIRIKDTRYTSVADFKTWLSTHNVTMYYVLLTPTTTEITDENLISQLETVKLLSGTQNSFTIDADTLPTLNLNYIGEASPHL